MARITDTQKQEVAEKILNMVLSSSGIREVEISEILKIERKTVNNYLRELKTSGRIYKTGYNWFASGSELDMIEADLHKAISRLFDYLRNQGSLNS